MIHVYFSDCGFSCAFSTLLSEISIKQVIIFTNGAFLCKFLFFMDPCLLKVMYFSFFLLCRNSPEYYDVISTPIDLLKIQVN